jgi:hypothetical protein
MNALRYSVFGMVSAFVLVFSAPVFSCPEGEEEHSETGECQKTAYSAKASVKTKRKTTDRLEWSKYQTNQKFARHMDYIQSWENADLGIVERYAPGKKFSVTDPSTLLLDIKARVSYFEANPQLKRKYCASVPSRTPFSLIEEMVVTQAQLAGNETDQSKRSNEAGKLIEQYTRVARHFSLLTTGCLRGKKDACWEIVSEISEYADARAPYIPSPNSETYFYSINAYMANTRILKPALLAYAVARGVTPEAVGGEQHKSILKWFKTLAISSEERVPFYVQSDQHNVPLQAYNHFITSSLAFMMYGVLAKDDQAFRRGIEQYFVTLNSAREDGSLPYETRRGNASLSYSGHAINMLMMIAEIARHQDYDLYGMSVGEKTIHDVVGYFLSAFENIDVITPYAKEDHGPAAGGKWREQDLRFDPREPFGWVDLYVNRFPQHANTKNILDMVIDDRIVCKPMHATTAWKDEGGCVASGTKLADLIKDAYSFDLNSSGACLFRTAESPIDGIYVQPPFKSSGRVVWLDGESTWKSMKISADVVVEGELKSIRFMVFKDESFYGDLGLMFWDLPGTNVSELQRCGDSWGTKRDSQGRRRVAFMVKNVGATRCVYKKLNERNKEVVSAVFSNLEVIVKDAISRIKKSGVKESINPVVLKGRKWSKTYTSFWQRAARDISRLMLSTN